MDNIDSEIRLFAEDCVCYRQIHSIEDTEKKNLKMTLTAWINGLGNGAWDSNPLKCIMMQLNRKRINKAIATYTLVGTVLENVDRINYLGVTITNNFRWNTHIDNTCTKANRTLGFLNLTSHRGPKRLRKWHM